MDTRLNSLDLALLAAVNRRGKTPKDTEKVLQTLVLRIAFVKLDLPLQLSMDRRCTSAVLFDGVVADQHDPAALTIVHAYAIHPDVVAELKASYSQRRLGRDRHAAMFRFTVKKLVRFPLPQYGLIHRTAAIVSSADELEFVAPATNVSRKG